MGYDVVPLCPAVKGVKWNAVFGIFYLFSFWVVSALPEVGLLMLLAWRVAKVVGS
jgi:hypothetical protein